MRSIKGGFFVVVGMPVALALLFSSSWALQITSDKDFWGFVFLGILAWWVYAALALVPCAVRLSASRRLRSPYLPFHESAWRSRQGSSVWNGFKLVAIVVLAFLLILLAGAATKVKDPGTHRNVVTVDGDARSVAITLHPDLRSCRSAGELSIRPGDAVAAVTSEGRAVASSTASQTGESTYRLPMVWDRSSSSCYYQFPQVLSPGRRTAVYLYAPIRGSAADSTPPPTRALGGYWGWRCRASRTGDGCAVLAVIDYNPNELEASLALLLVGALITAGLSLLFTVARSLSRGWAVDGVASWDYWKEAAAAVLSCFWPRRPRHRGRPRVR